MPNNELTRSNPSEFDVDLRATGIELCTMEVAFLNLMS